MSCDCRQRNEKGEAGMRRHVRDLQGEPRQELRRRCGRRGDERLLQRGLVIACDFDVQRGCCEEEHGYKDDVGGAGGEGGHGV